MSSEQESPFLEGPPSQLHAPSSPELGVAHTPALLPQTSTLPSRRLRLLLRTHDRTQRRPDSKALLKSG